MRIPAILALALLLCAPGLRAEEASQEIREMLSVFFQATGSQDWGGIYDLITEDSRQGLSREDFASTRGAASGNAFAKAMSARIEYEVQDIAVEGDDAEADVQVNIPDLQGVARLGALPSAEAVEQVPLREMMMKVQLRREGGAWRVVRRPPSTKMPPEVAQKLNQGMREQQDRIIEQRRKELEEAKKAAPDAAEPSGDGQEP